MCQICGQPFYVQCSCSHAPCAPCSSDTTPCTPTPAPCSEVGCMLQLDSACIFYHKDTNDASELVNLDIENGATLEEILHAVDDSVGSLEHFKGNVNADPTTLVDGDYWFRTDLAAADGLKIRVNGTTRTIPTT